MIWSWLETRGCHKKRMDATNVGVRRVHPYLWSLSSPQQPLETEDSPTVSSCPTIYIATHVPGKIHTVNKLRSKEFPSVLCSTCYFKPKTPFTSRVKFE